MAGTMWKCGGIAAIQGRGYIEARTDTTQQSGQTPDKGIRTQKHYFVCQRLH